MVSRELIERLSRICKLSEEEIFEEANKQIAIIINTEEISEQTCINLVIYAMQMGAAADGKLCAEEYEMAKAVFNYAFDSIDPEELRDKLTKPVDDVEIALMRKIVEEISSKSVEGLRFARALCDLMMCIIVIDGKVTEDELDVLSEIFDRFLITLGLMYV